MKSHLVSRRNKKNLLVFCNGWGMDCHPFLSIDSKELDVLILYDYRDLDIPSGCEKLLSEYNNRYLLCWSMGVWAGQQLFYDQKELFKRRIAMNGTLQPISDKYGIPCEIYDNTLLGYSQKGQERFYRRMCREKSVLATFLTNRPQRNIEGQKEELSCLQKMTRERKCGESIYTDIIISENDLVMPTQNQKDFWKSNPKISIAGCHFPFTRWHNWSDILKLVEANG